MTQLKCKIEKIKAEQSKERKDYEYQINELKVKSILTDQQSSAQIRVFQRNNMTLQKKLESV